LAATNRWLTAADACVARYPTKLAFCSRFRRQRETSLSLRSGDFLWLLGRIVAKNVVQKRCVHKAQKGRRWKNRQPSQSALKFT
jgi:hypothetical protein